MTTAAEPKPARTTRLGRPPASDSAETKRRIISVARRHFAERGYARTTLKGIAEEVGLTSGALYYYFDSKASCFLAITYDTRQLYDARLTEHMAGATTLVDKLKALVDTAAELNDAMPEHSAFSYILDIESRRVPELRTLRDELHLSRESLHGAIVAEAIERGELPKDVDQQAMRDVINVLRMGVWRFMIDQPDAPPARKAAARTTMHQMIEAWVASAR